ncbi:N-acetyltransferase [Aerococcaceae bacterium NML160702]|nr:N-acetyltransferase [Aerococcaceae bacterium NML191219]MCW6676954.1 N-acetyltransferase [Aerococcaceae bacterium NML180378]MCW6682707.1 N-acetyltransferase [Aerococcaceae bacterium NML160702]MDO4774994.1 GNAT family N-acetyltransferase [Aerococcaceae bacterium]
MEFTREANGFFLYDDAHEMIAEITYAPTDDPNIVEGNHTYVNPSLRGQGVADKLLDALVEAMRAEGKKIRPTCSFIVKRFEENPKYADIKA